MTLAIHKVLLFPVKLIRKLNVVVTLTYRVRNRWLPLVRDKDTPELMLISFPIWLGVVAIPEGLAAAFAPDYLPLAHLAAKLTFVLTPCMLLLQSIWCHYKDVDHLDPPAGRPGLSR